MSNVVAEVHSFGSDGAHVALVGRVTDTNKKLVGLLHLSMPLSVIESVASTFDFAGTYIEIRQKAIPLSTSGDAKFRKGLPVSVGIKGTNWIAASWDESSLAAVTEAGSALSSPGGPRRPAPRPGALSGVPRRLRRLARHVAGPVQQPRGSRSRGPRSRARRQGTRPLRGAIVGLVGSGIETARARGGATVH